MSVALLVITVKDELGSRKELVNLVHVARVVPNPAGGTIFMMVYGGMVCADEAMKDLLSYVPGDYVLGDARGI